MLALFALDQVDHVLGMQLLEWQVAIVQGFLEKFGVTQQLVRLLAQSDAKADTAGCRRDAYQDVAHMHQ